MAHLARAVALLLLAPRDEPHDRTLIAPVTSLMTSGFRSQIPLFALSVPSIGAVGGPFRLPGKHEAYVVRGSMDEDYFFKLFQVILRDNPPSLECMLIASECLLIASLIR